MRQKWKIIAWILIIVTLLSTGSLMIILLKTKRLQQKNEEDSKVISKIVTMKKSLSLQNPFIPKETFEGWICNLTLLPN